MPTLRIVSTAITDPVSIELLTEMIVEIEWRYGDDISPDDAAQLAPLDLTARGDFFIAWLDDAPVGCAALRPFPYPNAPPDGQTAELKRMFVRPAARGNGIASALLDRVEQRARALGYRRLWLETGTAQPEAIQFYERRGYQPIPTYGQYADDPRSWCYGKSL